MDWRQEFYLGCSLFSLLFFFALLSDDNSSGKLANWPSLAPSPNNIEQIVLLSLHIDASQIAIVAFAIVAAKTLAH